MTAPFQLFSGVFGASDNVLGVHRGASVVDVAKVGEIVTAKVTELTIEIPEIVVLPTREVTFGYHDFDLQGLESIARQPVSDQIMVQRLRDDLY